MVKGICLQIPFPLAPLAPSAGPTADKPLTPPGLPSGLWDMCTNRAGKKKKFHIFPLVER